MRWVIQRLNGNNLYEHKDFFDLNNVHLIDKIYFEDGKNRYGFNYKTGQFFINNLTFDFKIVLNDFKMVPFQNKTAVTILNNPISHNVYSWNIGYNLINNQEKFEYKMSICYDNKIFFEAKHYINNKLIKQNKIQLR